MIERLRIDENRHPYGFVTSSIKSENCRILNKTCRADFYQMFWVKAGEVTIYIDSHTISIGQGECAFVDSNQIYRIETQSHFEVLTVQFTERFYCRHELDVKFLESCVFFGTRRGLLKFKLHPSLGMILDQYYLSLQHISKQPYNELLAHFAHNTIERLLLFSQKELSFSTISPAKVENVEKTDQEIANHFRQLVKQHAKDEKQVTYYTDKLSISDKRLTEICNTIFGQSPKKIITEQVVLEAKRLLQYSNLNIKEIAYELKFMEPSNFIRFFATATGMSPKEYRDSFWQKDRKTG